MKYQDNILEAPVGFEPTNKALLAFALDHLATAPLQIYSNKRISKKLRCVFIEFSKSNN